MRGLNSYFCIFLVGCCIPHCCVGGFFIWNQNCCIVPGSYKCKDPNPVMAVHMKSRSITTLQEDEKEDLVTAYLQRIGIVAEDIEGYQQRGPNANDLQNLYTAHLRTVPFENMDQHDHSPGENGQKEIPFIPRRKELPSLDVKRSLNKIVYDKRGGFCFELNFSFAWLLRNMRYSIRLALADVGCQQATTAGKFPAHVILLVDGLQNDQDNIDNENDLVYLVDPGFGNPGVCDLILPLVYDKPFMDSQGDIFEMKRDESGTHERFDSILFRTRATTTGEQESMYRFCSRDNLDYFDSQFENGLDYVLTRSDMFNNNRICVLTTQNGGHVTLGTDYIKWVEKGKEVKRVELPSESSWREALMTYFGVSLKSEIIQN